MSGPGKTVAKATGQAAAATGKAVAGKPGKRAGALSVPGWLFAIGRWPGAGRSLRLRLIDAAALSAAGLLVLKLAGFFFDERGTKVEPPPAFGRILFNARSSYEPGDPVITGATTPKEEPKAASPAEPPRPEIAVRPEAPGSPTERAILERLGERRDVLQKRNRDLDVRERLLENAEKRLEARIGDLKASEDRVDTAAGKRGETEAAALKNVVTMYETMKPKDAARVFDRLSLEVLVPVVLQMNPRKMAEVLAAMQPEAAEKLTVALATRARGFTTEARAAPLPAGELPAIGTPAR